MGPADPKSSGPEGDPYEASDAEEAEEALAADAHDLDALRLRADVPGLLALAKAYRAGTAPGGRDMAKCLLVYRAAADLEDPDALYAVTLFHMNGGSGVMQDLKEGTARLRSAAEKGSVPAKVYLGNLYELGINYKVDAEKADVWYRNAGRTARIEAVQGSPEWDRALAELGCARHVLARTRDPAVDDEEKKRLLARAKAHGYGLRIRDEITEGDRATVVDALAGTDADPRPRQDTMPETKNAKLTLESRKSQPAPDDDAAKAKATAATIDADPAALKRAAATSARVRSALAAFGYALLFVGAGTGAGYAAMLGARELVADGHVLPIVGTHARLVFPIVLGVVGILPAWLVYRFGTVLKALAMGAALGGIGWVAWGTGQGALHRDRPLQAIAFFVAGFLAGLLVLGLTAGAKLPNSVRPSR